ncbi:MAG: hypothetical protein KAS78_05800 [Candidatus Pacebacteria bacterium]|nr:hypothetical protein [Candidatus Paceibacterota bacterium]
MLFKKNLYLILFIFFFIFSGSNAYLAQAISCKKPADAVLAIDRSANMAGGSKFDTVKNSSVDFINNLFAIPPYDSFYPYNYHQIGLVVFNNNITSELLTTDDTYIKDVILNLEIPDSSCEAGLAVQKAQANLNANGNSEATKTIIILIAGPPDDLAFAIEQVGIAKESGTRIISVGIDLDELADPQRRADAENFISNEHIFSYDCYYVSNNSDIALDECVTISVGDLNSSLNTVYNDITEAVCDEIAPELEIYRIPAGTLYDIDKLIITSIATDDVGFQSHSIVWSDDWPNNQREITDCGLIGKIISCDTGEIGPFVVGETINFSSSATDANNNVITIEPLNNDVKVASVSLNVPVLFRNQSNEIDIQILDYFGVDEFYIRIDNGGLIRIIDENDASSKMTCSGTGSTRDCVYFFNPSCVLEGVYTDPGNAVDVYVYAESSGTTRSSHISSELNNTLGLSSEGVTWGNCGNEIDDDCDGIIDSDEISCDSDLPIVTIARTNPIETSEVYDDDLSITLKSEASDNNSTIKRNTIYYRIAGSPTWETAFDCNDVTVIDGKCDDDISKSIASYSVVVDSIFPVLAGTEIEYYSKAVDSSGNDNTSSTSVKSFMVKSRECDGKIDLEDCNVTPGGKCCGSVCNASAVNSGPFGSYNTDFCAELFCDGTVLEWMPNSFTGQCWQSGDSDSCYSYTPDPLISPFLTPDSYDNNGCEVREYRCNSGYCNYGFSGTRRIDGCDVFGPNPLIWRDFQCELGECKPIQEWEDEQCDDTISFTDLTVMDGDGINITGEPEVLDSKTDKIRITANVADPSGILDYKLFWQLNGGAWQERGCGSCGPSTEATACSCTQEIGPFEPGDFINYYMWSQDNSVNQNEGYEGFDGGLNYNYYDGISFNTFKGGGNDTSNNHVWGSSSVIINADNVWENQSDTVSVIWEGFVTPNALGEHILYVKSDDGIRFYVDGVLAVNKWFGQSPTEYSVNYDFTSLSPIPIKIEWYENAGGANMQLGWDPVDGSKVYPIPAINLISPFAIAIRDSECFDIPFDYSVPGVEKNDISTSCDAGNGICCGGYCDSSPSSTSYSEECRVDSCSGINWVYAVSNVLGDTKQGDSCGGTDTCFDHYSLNNNFYSGCITGGNKCSSGQCVMLSTSTSTPSCSGNLLTNYSCNPDNATGSCQPKDSDTDCSSIGDYDSDGVDCNCDCNRYDIEEKVYSSLSFDGMDDYVQMPSINPTEAITVSAWVKSSSNTGYGGVWQIVSKYDAYILGTSSTGGNNMCFITYDTTWRYGSCYAVPDPENWHYFVGTYDNSNKEKKLYVDGILRSTSIASSTIRLDSGPIHIGHRECCSGYYFGGFIDDVRIYDRALYPEEVQDHYNGIFADNSGLVGHWDFDEGIGETAEDNSGNGNDGALLSSDVDGKLYNMDNNDWVGGKYGNGLDFDGSNDYVSINNNLDVNPKNFSVSFWVNSSDDKFQMLFIDTLNSYSSNIEFKPSTNEICMESYTNNLWDQCFTTSINIDDGQWHNYVLIGASDSTKLYTDGVNTDIESASTDTANFRFRIISGYGNTNYTYGSWFNGLIDEVRIYNRALSETEAEDHHKGIFSDNSGLVGYWDLNEDSGIVAHDNSRNGPEWTKYHYDSASGIGGNVPVPWQVCTDGKDNDCDSITDEYEAGDSWCDGKIDDVLIEASSRRIGVGGAVATATINGGVVTSVAVISGGSGYTSSPVVSITDGDGSGAVATAVLTGGVITSFSVTNGGSGYTSSPAVAITEGNLLNFLTPVDYDIYDIDVSQAPNDFTLSAVISDEFGIFQTLIEWTTDNWGTTNNIVCNSTGVCKACVIGGTCSDDIIDPSSLVADTVLTYRACAWDNNNNKTCSNDYSFVILNSNSTPWLTEPEAIVPNFCDNGLEYILSWKFNDDDILDKQSYYEVQVKEDNNDFTTGPFVINLLKYVTVDNASFSYHPIINGENLEYGEKEYYWRVRVTDNKTGGYAKTSEWVEGDLFTTPVYKLPQIEFSANNLDLGGNPDKDCFLEECNFGEDIVFHDDTALFASCNSSSDKQCLSVDAAKCDVSEGQCVSCSDNSECSKFNSLPNIHYSCIAGICEIFGSCASDDDCKSVDTAKCDSSACVACDTDLQCAQFTIEDEYGNDIGYICNAGKCEFPNHRTWDFYSYGVIGSTYPDPINNYVESVYNNYDVILKITDITGEYCAKSNNIKLGGDLYPKWNEVSSSN